MRNSLIVICIIIWTSCQNVERTYLVNTVKEWEGKKIKFPTECVIR
jgi:hypothetical protein